MPEITKPSVVPRRRLQFSLRTGLAIVLIAAIGVSVWISVQQSDRNHKLQAENEALHARLRNELGELEIKDADRNKLQAIAIPTIEPMTWKWRVYIPPDKKFYLNNTIRGVSDDNLPPRGAFCGPISPGEQLMTIALRKDPTKDDQWQWIVQCGGTECSPILTGANAAWIQRPSSSTFKQAGQKQTEIAELGKPLQILRYRSFPQPKIGETGTGTSMSGVGDGILVWIQENKSTSGDTSPQATIP